MLDNGLEMWALGSLTKVNINKMNFSINLNQRLNFSFIEISKVGTPEKLSSCSYIYILICWKLKASKFILYLPALSHWGTFMYIYMHHHQVKDIIRFI